MPKPPAVSEWTALKLVAVLAVSIFVGEAVLMSVLGLFRPLPGWVEGAVDGLALVILLFPALYYLMLRPLQQVMSEREAALRRAARLERGKSEARFRLLVESSPTGILMVDRAGTIVLVNSKTESQFGYDPKELVGQSVQLLVPEAHRPKHGHDVVSYLEDPHVRSLGKGRDLHGRRKDGSVFPAEIALAPVETQEGPMVLATVVDITTRKKVEQERLRLSTAIEQAAEGIIVTDPDGTIQYVNPSFERISGYSSAEAVGQNPRILKSGEHDEAFYKDLWGTISAGKVWKGRVLNRRKDGTVYPEDSTISPVLDESGQIMNYVAVKHDVSESVALETQVRQLQSLEAIGQLAGSVAHDFNNLLTVVSVYTELVLDRLDDDEAATQDLQQVLQAADSSAELVRQLLAFSRQQTLDFKVVDARSLIRESFKMLKRIIPEEIEVVISAPPGIGKVRVDEGQIQRVVVNLVANAVDAMPRGGSLSVEIAPATLDQAYCRTHLAAKPGEYVLFSITDTGSGMDIETQRRIFEPFFTTKRVGKGTGLGLATVYGIVQQHDGHIAVYSEPGRGTTFKVYLPRGEEHAEDAESGTHSVTVAPRKGSETILAVDDDGRVRELVKRTLEMYGYKILTASHPTEAQELFARHREEIALLLTDVVMPDIDGTELYHQLSKEASGLKVLYMSGYTSRAARKKLLEPGTPFLSKPFTLVQLAQSVRQALDA